MDTLEPRWPRLWTIWWLPNFVRLSAGTDSRSKPLSTSLVSHAELAELRTSQQAQLPGDVDKALETPAEIVGFLIHRLRGGGPIVKPY